MRLVDGLFIAAITFMVLIAIFTKEPNEDRFSSSTSPSVV